MTFKVKLFYICLINYISDLYVGSVLFFKIKSLPLGVVVARGLRGQLLSIAIYNHLKEK